MPASWNEGKAKEAILNADVYIEMLASARFALLLNHDDEEREFAYTSGAERSLADAKELGWTVITMKDDWRSARTCRRARRARPDL